MKVTVEAKVLEQGAALTLADVTIQRFNDFGVSPI